MLIRSRVDRHPPALFRLRGLVRPKGLANMLSIEQRSHLPLPACRSSRARLLRAPASIIYYLVHALVLTVGVILTELGGQVWPAIGTSLIATGAAGWVIYLYVAQTEGIRERLQVLNNLGIISAFDRRAAQIRSQYADRLRVAKKSIDIIGFGLSDFRRDYMAELPALAARTTVRILLIDPNSPTPATSFCDQRDREEGQTEGTIASQVNEFLQALARLPNRPPTDRLQVRLYQSLPLVNLFRIDDEILWGPFFVGRASGNTTTQVVRRGGVMYDQLMEHFEEVWTKFSRTP